VGTPASSFPILDAKLATQKADFLDLIRDAKLEFQDFRKSRATPLTAYFEKLSFRRRVSKK
jgi:hypothetical protein